jgi:putative ABC transport system permease protein
MMGTLWFAWRLLIRAPRRTLATLVGLTLAAGMLGAVLFFVTASAHTMTQRAVSTVVVDLQAELHGGPDAMLHVLPQLRTAPHVVAAERFALASFAGSTLTRGGSVSTTAAGALVAVDPRYLQTFPAFRLAQGTFGAGGIAISQDMGTNLGARVGDTIAVQLSGHAGSFRAPVTGVLNVKRADVVFLPIDPQLRGAPANPPVDIIVMPYATFTARYASRLLAQAPSSGAVVIRPGAAPVSAQVHLLLDHNALPADPSQAQTFLTGLRRELEKPFAGQVTIADNLAGALDAASSDSVWATVLFVFLALPGVALAGIFARGALDNYLAIQAPEFALLRARGVDGRRLLALVGATLAGLVVGGVLLGLAIGLAAVRLTPGVDLTGSDTALLRAAGLALAGSLLIAGVVVGPPLRTLLAQEVVDARRRVARSSRPPLWQRLYLDIALVLAGLAVYRITVANGFHPVLNGEGNPTLSLSLYTFLAPFLFWTGAVLAGLRLAMMALRRLRWGGGGNLSTYVLAGVRRRAGALARAAMLTGLAIAFVVSVSIFATTYNQQQRVDAQLTLGADVKVTLPPARAGDPWLVAQLQRPGVAALSPFATTEAYVGTEIQDIFGIDAASLQHATTFSDTFFQGATAAQMLARLATTPDGLLVSDETARNYSIVPGDRLNLRLYDTRHKRYVVAPFHMVGVATEFVTAPKDAFLVANRAYVRRITGTTAPSFYLLRASGEPATLAQQLRAILPPGSQVQSIEQVSGLLATSLTAINLNGLARIESAFALAVLALGLAIFLVAEVGERRREFAVLAALGAAPRQAAIFLLVEPGLAVLIGLVVGLLVGRLLGGMLVIILAGIFDPPPLTPAVSWGTLAGQLAAALGAVVLVSALGVWRLRLLPVGNILRDA